MFFPKTVSLMSYAQRWASLSLKGKKSQITISTEQLEPSVFFTAIEISCAGMM